MLGNIRPELQSSHRVIQLVACVTTPNVMKYGYDAVLSPFIKDVNKLANVSCYVLYTAIWEFPLPLFFMFIQSGIIIEVDGRETRIHGTVLYGTPNATKILNISRFLERLLF